MSKIDGFLSLARHLLPVATLAIALSFSFPHASHGSSSGGGLDTTFGGLGTGFVTQRIKVTHIISAIAMHGDGILAAGTLSAPFTGKKVFAVMRFNPDGTLDREFPQRETGWLDMPGYILTPFYDRAEAKDIGVLPGGRFVVVGKTRSRHYNQNVFAFASYSGQGDLERTVTTNVGQIAGRGDSQNDVIEAIAIPELGDPNYNKKILVSGRSNMDMALVMYCNVGRLADGDNCDGPFGGDGVVVLDHIGNPSFEENAVDVAIYPPGCSDAGKIVVTTETTSSDSYGDFAVVRLCPNGLIDNGRNCGGLGFGKPVHDSMMMIYEGGSSGVRRKGYQIVDVSGRRDSPYALAIHPPVGPHACKVVVGGTAPSPGSGFGNLDFALARLNPNGTLDHLFGTHGVVRTDIGGHDDAIRSLAIQESGLIFALGDAKIEHVIDATGETDLNTDFAVVSYRANGDVDTGYGSGGPTTFDFGHGNDYATDILLQTDGRVITGGMCFNGAHDEPALIRREPSLTVKPLLKMAPP